MQGFPATSGPSLGLRDQNRAPLIWGSAAGTSQVRKFVHQAKGKQEIVPDKEWSGLVVHDCSCPGDWPCLGNLAL